MTIEVVIEHAVAAEYSCCAQFLRTVSVRERVKLRYSWAGDVYILELQGHPAASRAYAWVAPTGDGQRDRFVTALHIGIIRSPVDAVRAAIWADYKRANPDGA